MTAESAGAPRPIRRFVVSNLRSRFVASSVGTLLRLARSPDTVRTSCEVLVAGRARQNGKPVNKTAIIPAERIEGAILLIRGQKVMLDSDLAALYGVPTRRLNEQVRRNLKRFPADFMFQLRPAEVMILRSRSATSKRGRGGRRYAPLVFTEQGVAMLSSVLHSERAVQVNIEIMRTFVRLRRMLTSHADLARRLDILEKKYDVQFKAVFDAMRELMRPLAPRRRAIGFQAGKL